METNLYKQYKRMSAEGWRQDPNRTSDSPLFHAELKRRVPSSFGMPAATGQTQTIQETMIRRPKGGPKMGAIATAPQGGISPAGAEGWRRFFTRLDNQYDVNDVAASAPGAKGSYYI